MEQTENSWFSNVMEIFGWILVFLCPFLALSALGVLLFLAIGFWVGFALLIFFGSLGVVLGIAFARWVSNRMGTMFFLSRVSSTPQLDMTEDELKMLNKKSEQPPSAQTTAK